MAKKVTRKKSKAQLQKEISRLKKLKKEDAERKKLFAARAKEIKEIRELRAEARQLKGVGTKRKVFKELGKTGAKTAGKYGWSGLKALGKGAKAIVDAEAKRQAADAARARKKRKRK